MARQRFSIYDTFEFPPYKFAEFPKMVYHPKGELAVTSPGEYQSTPIGPMLRNVQKAMISKVVEDQDQLAAALKEGWHDSPVKAREAADAIAMATA